MQRLGADLSGCMDEEGEHRRQEKEEAAAAQKPGLTADY